MMAMQTSMIDNNKWVWQLVNCASLNKVDLQVIYGCGIVVGNCITESSVPASDLWMWVCCR